MLCQVYDDVPTVIFATVFWPLTYYQHGVNASNRRPTDP